MVKKLATSVIPLNKIELVYIKDQMNKIGVTSEAIADDLARPVAQIKKAIKALKAADVLPSVVDGMGQATKAPPASPLRPPVETALDKYSVIGGDGKPVKGVAVLRPDQAMANDKANGVDVFESHPVSEAQRAYIVLHKDAKSVEQLGKDTALPPFIVAQVVNNINNPDSGREKFFNRNKSTIHKIRPDEPFQ